MKEDERTRELKRMLAALNDQNRQRALSILRSLLFAQERQAGELDGKRAPPAAARHWAHRQECGEEDQPETGPPAHRDE